MQMMHAVADESTPNTQVQVLLVCMFIVHGAVVLHILPIRRSPACNPIDWNKCCRLVPRTAHASLGLNTVLAWNVIWGSGMMGMPA